MENHAGLPDWTVDDVMNHPLFGKRDLQPEDIPAGINRLSMLMNYRICRNWHGLRFMLQSHEATIRKRWTKKTKAQRLSILLKAWPDMPAKHRPDFRAFRQETDQQRRAGSKLKYHYLMPYINQEDLLKPRSLLLLLNSRGRHMPSRFAGADAQRLSFAICAQFGQKEVPRHTMLLNNFSIATMHMYGTMVSWDDNPEAEDWLKTQKQFSTSNGLLVLDVQLRLLSFLLNCCEQLLHDVPPHSTIADYPVQPEPKFEDDNAEFDSLTALANESPYCVPTQLDMVKIESLLSAEASAAEDRLWALREDPAYFYTQLMDTKDHRYEYIKDERGNCHPNTQPRRIDTLWAKALRTLMAETFLDIEVFSELRRQAQAISVLQAKYADVISPTCDLPDDYLAALVKFHYYLEMAVDQRLSVLNEEGPGAPPIRHLFIRRASGMKSVEIEARNPEAMSTVEDNLFWILSSFLEGSAVRRNNLTPLVVDELGRMLRDEPEVKRLISPYIARVIGDLSVLTACIQQLDLYYPRSKTFDPDGEVLRQLAVGYEGLVEPWVQVVNGKHFVPPVALIQPFKASTFSYPVEKYRTQANVEALRSAEASLDAYWDSMDEIIAKDAAKLAGTPAMILLSKQRVLQRTPEWTGPIQTKQQGAQVPNPVDCVYEPMSRLFTESSGDESPSEGRSLPKVKTRGTPHASDAEPISTDEEYHEKPQQIFEVDARALKVFRTIFFTPDVSATPGEIPWTDFCHAIVSVGFRAEKGFGSAWNFYPELDADRPIQFHEPHPKGKIPYASARRHGRRLHRAYGWGRESFVLKGRGGEM